MRARFSRLLSLRGFVSFGASVVIACLLSTVAAHAEEIAMPPLEVSPQIASLGAGELNRCQVLLAQDIMDDSDRAPRISKILLTDVAKTVLLATDRVIFFSHVVTLPDARLSVDIARQERTFVVGWSLAQSAQPLPGMVRRIIIDTQGHIEIRQMGDMRGPEIIGQSAFQLHLLTYVYRMSMEEAKQFDGLECRERRLS